MKLVKLFSICILLLSVFNPIYAEEDNYIVKSNSENFSIGFDNYDDAKDYYDDNLNNYDNLCLIKDDNVIEMEYGIVAFNGDKMNEYYSESRDTVDYICGRYGIDGAYLYTDDNDVYFKIAGDIGYIDIENVILYPIDSLEYKTSNYSVVDGNLYHNIKTQFKYEYYSESLPIDIKPSFMDEDKEYYSYDGHYFYDDFRLMIDDYRNDEYINCINESPYYNYYQYLPYRSKTNYTYDELNKYLTDVLGIDGYLDSYIDNNLDGANDAVNRSQIYEHIDEFLKAECLYGTNATMLLCASFVESNYGKSLDSYLNNNLFINAVYDTQEETNNNRYNNISRSINNYAKYFISKLYSNYLKSSYAGTNFGSKENGINIEYCLDHYYGEKASSEYYKLDRTLGFKDYNNYCLGVIGGNDRLTVYEDNELDDKLIRIDSPNNLVFVILDEYDNSYKVNIDYSFNSNYYYDFNSSIGYVDKDRFKVILNEENIHDYKFKTIDYDFNGGKLQDFDNISVNVINDDSDLYIKPYLEGYDFIDYDDNKVANYKKISNIKPTGLFLTQKTLLPYPDLSKAKLRINYEDGTYKIISFNSDMISKYDPYDSGVQEIVINYNGVTTSLDIQIDQSYYDEIDKMISAINTYDFDYVKSNIAKSYNLLSVDDIRNIDLMLRQENKRNYVIKDNEDKYDISISGLDLSLDDHSNFNLIEDTYYCILKDIDIYSKERILMVADGYGFEPVIGLNLSFKFNYQNIDLIGPIIVQIRINDKDDSSIYSVYHYSDDGDVIKCRTMQSKDYIQFVANEIGDYQVLRMDSVNNYLIENGIENLNKGNVGFDNNRINIEFLLGLSMIVLALIGIIVYYRIEDLKEKDWKDYRKSLQKAGIVQEEKQSN